MKNQRQRNIVAHCTIARTISGTGQAGVFKECTVSNVMVQVFNTPVSPVPLKQLFRIGSLYTNRSDAKHNLCARTVRFFDHLAVEFPINL